MDRRTVLLGLGGLALTGCTAPGSAVGQIISSYRALERAKKNYPVTRADIEGQPAGVLGAQVEGGLKGLVVWQRREAGYDYWRSGNGVIVVTERGRLIRTSGFPQDQLASRLVSGLEPVGLPMDRSRNYRFSRELDLLPDQYGLEAAFDLSYSGQKTIDLLGQSRQVEEWEEIVRFPRSRKKWKQLLQIDAETGEVLRSIQHVGHDMRLILELLQVPKTI